MKKARAERRTARLFEQGKEELDEEGTDTSREGDAVTSSSRPSKRARRSRSMSRVTRSSRSSSRRSYLRSTHAEDEAEDEDERSEGEDETGKATTSGGREYIHVLPYSLLKKINREMDQRCTDRCGLFWPGLLGHGCF